MNIFFAKHVYRNKLFADHADPKFHGFHSVTQYTTMQSVQLSMNKIQLKHINTAKVCNVDLWSACHLLAVSFIIVVK
jgi:hypothetical protein